GLTSLPCSAPLLASRAELPIDDPRWREPVADIAQMPTVRMGPPPRSLAADAHDCIMVRIQTDLPYTSLWREVASPSRAPSDHTRTGIVIDWRLVEKAHLAVHLPSACSGVKALRNTSAAKRQAAKLCYRFGPLTPSARSANLIAGDGTKNGFPAPNKEPAKSQKRLLDRKSPIQVRIPLPLWITLGFLR